jgi:hypothetical protein
MENFYPILQPPLSILRIVVVVIYEPGHRDSRTLNRNLVGWTFFLLSSKSIAHSQALGVNSRSVGPVIGFRVILWVFS